MFIGRNPDGSIYGVWVSKQPSDRDHPNMEEVADDHPDLIAYKNRVDPVVIDPRDAKLVEFETRIATLETKVAALEKIGVL